jgi:hypothetical protein
VKNRACAELEHTNNHREEADIVTPSKSSENAAEEKKEEGEQTELLSLEMVSMPGVVNSSSSHQEKGEVEGETEGGGGDVRQLVDQMTVNYAKFRSFFLFSVKDFRILGYQATIESNTVPVPV